MVFLWAIQSGGPGQQRRRRLEAAKQAQRSVGQGPGEMPGLPVETAKAKAAPGAPAPRKRTGTAAE